MKTRVLAGILAACLASSITSACAPAGGEGGGEGEGEGEPEAFEVRTVLEDLEYPSAMWVRDGEVVFSETAERGTSFGGALRVRAVDVESGEDELVVDQPVASSCLVVTSDGSIIAGDYTNTIPGDAGVVYRIDRDTGDETPLAVVATAVNDMFIDADDGIVVAGAGINDADSLLRLPAGAYGQPQVLATDLGMLWSIAMVGDDILYADQQTTLRRSPDGTTTTFVDRRLTSLAPAGDVVFAADLFGNNVVRIDLATGAETTLLEIDGPANIRFDAEHARLYVLTQGTPVNEFKDGTLLEVRGALTGP